VPNVDIAANIPRILELSGGVLAYLGPEFTGTPEGHIQTNIAAASSLAGLMALQEAVADLPAHTRAAKPGTVILSDCHDLQGEVMGFMANYCASNGLGAQGWGDVTGEHDPMFECAEMTRRLAPPFYRVCAGLDRPLLKFVAAAAGMRILMAGVEMGIVDEARAKGMAAYYVVAGSKTVPYPEACWPPEAGDAT
jgi:hypothetical protein